MESRRSFIKTCLAAAGFLTVLPAVLSAEEKRRGGGAAPGGASEDLKLPLADPEKTPAAKALNYQHDKTKFKDAALKAARQGVEWKDQSCANCGLFNGVGDGKLGKCVVIPGYLVKGPGWCPTWNKKS